MGVRTKKMQTTLVFGEDGTIEVHNVAVGDSNDHCETDIAEIRELLEGEGVQVLTDRSLACDAPKGSNAALTTGYLDQPSSRRTGTKPQAANHVYIQEGG